MIPIRKLMLMAIASLLWAGVSSATPIGVALSLDWVDVVGPITPVTQAFDPDPPTGSGWIDVAAGTGVLTLGTFDLNVDLAAFASGGDIHTVGWEHTILFLPGLAGAGVVTSTAAGSSTCVPYGGIGSAICAAAEGPTLGWPPAGGSATIDTLAQTIVTISAPDALAGTIFTYYSYTITPEPGTALLLGAGLVCLGVAGRRRRA